MPPQVSRDVRQPDSVDAAPNRLSSGSDSSGGDVDIGYWKELPLELDSAVDTLAKLHQEVYGAIEKLKAVHQTCRWLSRDTVEDSEEDMKVIIFRLRQSVHEMIDFGQGSVVNAARNGERSVARRLQRFFEPISKMAAVIDDVWSRLHQGAGPKL